MKILLNILVNLARFVVASTLLFSGIVKVLDPMGMSIKLAAYLTHWGIALPPDTAVLPIAAILLGTMEFALGVWLTLGMRRRLTTLTILLLMVGLTALTTYVYLYNPVPDCGCFGEAITLSNGQTLTKNILLLLLAVLLCWQRQRLFRLISEHNQWLTSSWCIIFCIILGTYSWQRLPIVDFTPYRPGTSIPEAMQGEFDVVDGQSVTLKEPSIPSFALFDADGNDATDQVLSDSVAYIVAMPFIQKANSGTSDRLNTLYDYCQDHHLGFYAVISEDLPAYESWRDRTGSTYPVLFSDAETLEAMVRSNPGLIMLRQGRIIRKWHYENIPTEEQLPTLSALQPEDRSQTYIRLAMLFFIPLVLVIVLDRLWALFRLMRVARRKRKKEVATK